MPLNIYDKNDNYLGFIKESYPYNSNVFLVALTSYKITDKDLKVDKMKDYLASLSSCKNILGKINEEKFKKAVDELLKEEAPEFKELDYEDYMKCLFLKNCSDISKCFNEDLKVNDIKGYILFNMDDIAIKNNHIVINEDLNYIEEKASVVDVPIFAKIMDYPLVYTDIMGIGEGFLLGADLADFSRRNHSHSTKLNILSGNFSDTINLPVHIFCKKDLNLQLYFNGTRIDQVFCDGVFYSF